MQKTIRPLVLAAAATLCFNVHLIAAEQKTEDASATPKKSAELAKAKADEALQRMADYLAKLPAVSCRLEAKLEVTAPQEDPVEQVTKMTVRLERPNKLALLLDEGKMGLTVVSDGKQLLQYLAVLGRYSVGEAPADYAEMTNVGVPLKGTILGSTGALIPVPGEAYIKLLTSAVTKSEYVGAEKVGNVECYRLRFTQKNLDWDIWIDAGKQPLPQKVAVDLSKQFADEKATITYTVAFSDWNVAPKFKDADFTFKPPATAEQVDELIEPEPPHPLLGKPAPEFKTVDLDGHPFDLKSQLGKSVIMLDFWSTSCGPCIMLMPELEAVAQKFADRGVVYRAINGGEDAESIKAFLDATKIKASIVMDPDLEIWRAYRVEPIPQTVLIGKDGKVQVVHLGYSPAIAGEISKEIEELLAGKDLAAEELGKRKKPKK